MSKFNFYDFLSENGYEREPIRKKDGTFFSNNYQKQLDDGVWNCLTIHDDKTISGANPYSHDIKFIRRDQPTTIEEAKLLIQEIEEEKK